MVDTRQVLKSNVETELKKKILSAQKILTDLQGAVQHVEENSARAKGEVTQAVENAQKLIANRKLEINEKIDVLCQQQISSIQDEIQATYAALGSLQSLLSNLDYFDHTQLKNLHIPQLLSYNGVTAPVELNFNNLEENIKQWGQVKSGSATGKEFSDIENWLSCVKLHTSEGDDFEVISVEIPVKDSKTRDCSTSQSAASNTTGFDERSNDLSKWLKPRKNNVLIGKENISHDNVRGAAFLHNPLKNRFVDFPCLRTDPAAWVTAKRARISGPQPQLPGKKDIVPPEYSRPAKYWLLNKC